MPDLVTLTIDDNQVTVPAGTLVVDAAKAAGIEIPVFCSHPKLDPLGACRMCLVEFVGPRDSKLDTACTVRVANGMVVRTDSEQVQATREAVLGFILINHPLDCPICDKGGECPLQDQTMAYGPGVSQFVEPKRHKQKHYPISDLIMLDQERCILCWRCIRYLEEWEDKPQLGLFERGGETIIDTFPGRPVDAKTSGNIIDICPVGALTNRVDRFRFRPWQLTKTPSICTLCPVGCNLRLDERVHELRRIVARENAAVNDEWICDKGRFLHQYVDHPARLATPLVREGSQLRPAAWDEALGRIVERLGTIVAAKGADAVGGVTGAAISNEAAYLFQKFFRANVGTNNIDFPTGSAVKASPTGLSAIADIAKSDLIVLVGLDPSEATPVLDLHIKRAARRGGARLLIIHPRRIELAKYPGAYLPVLPGGEAALLSELAAAIQAGKSASQRVSKSQVASRKSPVETTQYAVRSTQYAPVIELLLSAKSPLFLYGPDAATGERGRAAVVALANLANALGQGDKLAYIGAEANDQGARDMGLLPDALPGHQPVADAAVRERLGKLWGVQPPVGAGLSYRQMVNGGVRGLFVMAADPAADPVSAEALRGLDFLVVQDLFLTETAALADVVLPLASFAEADGTYTNLERRVQRAPQGIRPVGESRSDWATLLALSECWLTARCEPAAETVEPDWKKKRRKAKQGGAVKAAPKAWHYPSAGAVLDEIAKAAPFYANIRWESLGEQGTQWSTRDFRFRISDFGSSATQKDVSQTASLRPSTGQVQDSSTLLRTSPPSANEFWLVASPLLWDGSTLMQHGAEQARELIPQPFVALNPADVAANGLTEGSSVMVSAARGAVRLSLRGDASVQPGTAWIPVGLTGAPAETLGAGRGEPVLVTVQVVV